MHTHMHRRNGGLRYQESFLRFLRLLRTTRMFARVIGRRSRRFCSLKSRRSKDMSARDIILSLSQNGFVYHRSLVIICTHHHGTGSSVLFDLFFSR